MRTRTLEHARLAMTRHTPRAMPLIEGALNKAAVVAVLRQTDELEVLLIVRAEHPKDPWSGHIALPGGRVDDTDLGPLSAARREAHEEVGLDLHNDGALLGELSHVPVVSHGGRPMVISPYVFELKGEPELTLDISEVQDTLWVPLSYVQDQDNRKSITRKFKGVPMQMACYHLGEHILWGLTLRMLDELVKAIMKP